MQLFPCPFCGSRDEREFHFVAEAGKARPDTAQPISDEAWAAYLYDKKNSKGTAVEVWMHLPCRELFVMKRDTVGIGVLDSSPLRKGTP